MMRSIMVGQFGGPEVLSVVESAVPALGPGQVRVHVAAAGVNYIDVYHRDGRYPRPLPLTLGLEGAGTVIEIGPGVDGLAPGDRVAWSDGPGSYADEVVVAADRLVPIPAGVSVEQAAAVMLQGMTAHFLLNDSYRVQPGDSILVHAAAGGVGLLLTQLARARGARVIGTVSTDEKEQLARGAGANEIIRYEREDVTERARELTDGRGVAAVYDGVGAATFDASLASLAMRGHMVLFGQSSGPVPPFDLGRLAAGGSLTITRPTLFHFVAERSELERRAADVLGAVADGSLNVRISARFPLAEAADAHRLLEGRGSTGKILLVG
jgi:NADPH:quinone reductase